MERFGDAQHTGWYNMDREMRLLLAYNTSMAPLSVAPAHQQRNDNLGQHMEQPNHGHTQIVRGQWLENNIGRLILHITGLPEVVNRGSSAGPQSGDFCAGCGSGRGGAALDFTRTSFSALQGPYSTPMAV